MMWEALHANGTPETWAVEQSRFYNMSDNQNIEECSDGE